MTFVRCFVSWTWCHGWCALARGAGGMKDGGDTFLPRHPFLPQRAARSTSRCPDLLIVGPSLRFTVLGPPFHFTVLRGLPYTYCVSSCPPYTYCLTIYSKGPYIVNIAPLCAVVANWVRLLRRTDGRWVSVACLPRDGRCVPLFWSGSSQRTRGSHGGAYWTSGLNTG